MEILDEDVLPPHSAFHSSLKNSNISEEKYEFVKTVWMEKNWKSIRDMLLYYNICDYQPFIEAVSKLLVPYLEEGLDIFKTSYSVSGVAKILIMKKNSKDPFFCLYPKPTQICTRKGEVK